MSVYRESAAGVLDRLHDGSLANRLAERLRMKGVHVSPAERRSWSRSLTVLAQDLVDAGLEKVEMLVEMGFRFDQARGLRRDQADNQPFVLCATSAGQLLDRETRAV